MPQTADELNREARPVTLSFTVNARTARSLMALYELIEHGLDISLDDPYFATPVDEWPSLWAFWIEMFMDRLSDGQLLSCWNERQKQFMLALHTADRSQFDSTD